MIVRLAGTGDGQVLVTFLRDDGTSSSRSVSSLFVHHELMHYAVEASLVLHSGMFGLIAGGRAAEEFDPSAPNWLPMEAQHAEAIVTALEAEVYGSATPADFDTNLRAICEDVGVPAPGDLAAFLLDDVRSEFATLSEQWATLPDDGILELPWQTPRQRTENRE